jgi:hypothetical protein
VWLQSGEGAAAVAIASPLRREDDEPIALAPVDPGVGGIPGGDSADSVGRWATDVDGGV